MHIHFLHNSRVNCNKQRNLTSGHYSSISSSTGTLAHSGLVVPHSHCLSIWCLFHRFCFSVPPWRMLKPTQQRQHSTRPAYASSLPYEGRHTCCEPTSQTRRWR